MIEKERKMGGKYKISLNSQSLFTMLSSLEIGTIWTICYSSSRKYEKEDNKGNMLFLF